MIDTCTKNNLQNYRAMVGTGRACLSCKLFVDRCNLHLLCLRKCPEILLVGESLRRIGGNQREPHVMLRMWGGDLCLGACEGRRERNRGSGRGEREMMVRVHSHTRFSPNSH